MKINHELNERNRKRQNKEIENQRSPSKINTVDFQNETNLYINKNMSNKTKEEIKREPMTPPPISRVPSNEETARRKEIDYNANRFQNNPSLNLPSSSKHSYRHLKSNDKIHVYSSHSRGNSKSSQNVMSYL